MSEQNEIIEDITIREAIDSIYDMLVEFPKAKRLAFFEQISKPKELDFVTKLMVFTMLFFPISIMLKMRTWWKRYAG